MSDFYTSYSLGATAHPDRPIYDGTMPIRTFLRKYHMWCLRVKWTGDTRVSNLPYCVSETFKELIETQIFADDGVTLQTWTDVNQWMLDEFSVGEDPKEHLNKVNTEFKAFKMKTSESVQDVHLYMEVVRSVNRARSEYNLHLEYRL